jgi:hypothetical protein
MPLLSTSPSTPRTGFGTVPSSIPIPPSVFSQLSGTVPNFTSNLGGAGNVINSQLSGQVSQGTLNALKTGAAQFGTASGMPGSGLEQNQLFGNIAGFSEGQQQKGIQNLLAQIGALGPTMTNPNLAAEISGRNADLAAAPDPRLAAQEQFNLWLKTAGTSSALANPSRGPWWAPGGINTPPIGATIGRSYAGGLPGPSGGGVFDTPDAFGYNFNNSEAGTTAVLGAINPQPNYYNPNAYANLYPGIEAGTGAGVDPGGELTAGGG